MTQSELSYSITDGVLRLRFGGQVPSRRIDLSCLVDLNSDGQVVGIEVLRFRRQLAGAEAPALAPNSVGHVSYDSEVDAFYVRIGHEPGQAQRKVSAVALLTGEGNVVGFDIANPEWPERY